MLSIMFGGVDDLADLGREREERRANRSGRRRPRPGRLRRRGLELVHHPQPELGALGVLDSNAEDLLAAVDVDPDGKGGGLVPHHAVGADLAVDRAEEDHRRST